MFEVIALHTADVQYAKEGGTDRVELLGTMDEDGLSPEPVMVAKVCRVASIQIRPMVRSRAGSHTDGGELVRLRGLIAFYLDEGTDRAALGFLNGHAGVDLEVCNALVADDDFAWTFHRAVDNCLDSDDAREGPAILPRLNRILTAGPARGVEHGLDKPLEQTRSNPGITRVITAGGGLQSEHVPWLIRVGVWAFHIGSPARPGGNYKACVDPDLMRTWRELTDRQVAAVRRSW